MNADGSQVEDEIVHIVGNAHIDPVWLWDWHEGMYEVLQTFTSAADRLDEHPDLAFTASSAAFYEWVERTDPALLERIARHVAAGRWIVTGGQWIEPDCLLPSGESVCRQLLYGQRLLARLFGRLATVGYNIDSFGHAGSLPQLLALGGITSYVFMRPGANEMQLPAPFFEWVGIDGTRLPAYRLVHDYATRGRDDEQDLARRASELHARAGDHMLFFGVGNHGGGPTNRAIAACRDMVDRTTVFSNPEAFFQMAATPACEHRGELVHHAVGCYSAVASVKRSNAVAEASLTTAEKMLELCRAMTGSTPPIDLTTAWKRVMFNQFHDSLGGTCTAAAHTDLDHLWSSAIADADEATTIAAQRVARAVDTSTHPPGHGTPLIVFNMLAHARAAHVVVAHPFGSATDRHGHAVDTQPVSSGDVTFNRAHTLIRVDLPPLGYTVVWLRRDRTIEPPTSTPPVTSTPDAMRIVPVVIDDQSDTWSHGVTRYDSPEQACALDDVVLTEDGPLRTTTVFTFRHGSSTIRQTVSRYTRLDAVEVRYSIDWHERHKVLKAVIPVDAATLTAGIPFGHATRDADGHEHVMQHWVTAGALTVTTDHTYAYDCTPDRLRITLLRSPRYADHGAGWAPPDHPYTDQGHHSCSLRLHPRGDGARLADEHVTPVPLLLPGCHPGRLDTEATYVRVSVGNVAVAAVKRAEDADAVVLRTWETQGRATTAVIELPGRRHEANFHAHEVKTLLVPDDFACAITEVPVHEMAGR